MTEVLAWLFVMLCIFGAAIAASSALLWYTFRSIITIWKKLFAPSPLS